MLVICMVILGMGLVSEVFDESKLKKLFGIFVIGYVWYVIVGVFVLKNV